MPSEGRLVIDAFPFFNELAMLEYRLNLLEDVVDYHVLVESDKTHAGNEKPLFFSKHKSLFEKFGHKIIHVIVRDVPSGRDSWTRENFQRDSIVSGLKRIPNLKDSDIVIVSDVDEIPNPLTISKLKEEGLVGFHRLAQDLYYFEATEDRYQFRWTHALVSDAKTAIECAGLSKERVYGSYAEIDDGGWHFSYFLTKDLVVNKIKQFAHRENYIQNFAREHLVERAMRGEIGMFERPMTKGKPSFALPPGTKELLDRVYELEPLVSRHNVRS
jgi:beta-1,4-mannosyl-glycoprotein beta-1,4-N-acetylglucosaminyltransferase